MDGGLEELCEEALIVDGGATPHTPQIGVGAVQIGADAEPPRNQEVAVMPEGGWEGQGMVMLCSVCWVGGALPVATFVVLD